MVTLKQRESTRELILRIVAKKNESTKVLEDADAVRAGLLERHGELARLLQGTGVGGERSAAARRVERAEEAYRLAKVELEAARDALAAPLGDVRARYTALTFELQAVKLTITSAKMKLKKASRDINTVSGWAGEMGQGREVNADALAAMHGEYPAAEETV